MLSILGHGQWMVKASKIKKKFKMSVTKFLQLILVNLRVLNPNLNVTKLEISQFLCNLRFFLRFQAKLQGLKIDDFWGVFKIKKDLYHVIELFKLSKKVYYIKVSTSLDQKLLAYLCFPSVFDHKYANNF